MKDYLTIVTLQLETYFLPASKMASSENRLEQTSMSWKVENKKYAAHFEPKAGWPQLQNSRIGCVFSFTFKHGLILHVWRIVMIHNYGHELGYIRVVPRSYESAPCFKDDSARVDVVSFLIRTSRDLRCCHEDLRRSGRIRFAHT